MKSTSNIVTAGDGTKQLVTVSKIQKKCVRQNVRPEDEYLRHISTIIERDFYPDLSELTGGTPADESIDGSTSPSDPPTQNPPRDPTSVGLDKYLANNTTEDNASFIAIVEDAERKRVAKLADFFPSRSPTEYSTNNSITSLAITDAHMSSKTYPSTLTETSLPEELIEKGPAQSIESITSHNAVHFIPDGAPLTAEELTKHFDRERKICPANSRFKRPLVPVRDRCKFNLPGGLLKAGRFGIDGKEVVIASASPTATPHAGGYKFMDASPSPSLWSDFGGAGTPLMTWGEVDSTPYRLDEASGRTPLISSGHSSVAAFRLPSPSKREALAHELADRAGKHRAKVRADAVKLAKSGFISPHTSKSILSPAARRLLSSSGKLSFGLRPNSGLCSPSVVSEITPRRLPIHLGVVRRPSTANSAKPPSTPREDFGPMTARTDHPGAITNDLLHLSTSKGLTSPPA